MEREGISIQDHTIVSGVNPEPSLELGLQQRVVSQEYNSKGKGGDFCFIHWCTPST